jgi:hypothetical protein
VWIIEPKTSVGPLRIGLTISEVKEELGDKYDTFKRLPDTEDTVFAFDLHGVHLTCGTDKRIRTISVFRPNAVLYSDIQLLGRRTEAVSNELTAVGIAVTDKDAGVWIEEAGVLLVDIDGNVDGLELYSEIGVDS